MYNCVCILEVYVLGSQEDGTLCAMWPPRPHFLFLFWLLMYMYPCCYEIKFDLIWFDIPSKEYNINLYCTFQAAIYAHAHARVHFRFSLKCQSVMHVCCSLPTISLNCQSRFPEANVSKRFFLKGAFIADKPHCILHKYHGSFILSCARYNTELTTQNGRLGRHSTIGG